MKKTHLIKNAILSLFTCTLLLVSCKKDKTTEQDASISYPTKIELVSTYNNNSTKVILYEFEYSDKKELKTIKYYNADSIYNAFSYNTSGKLTKMGTTKNPNALRIEYAPTGDISKVTESFRGPNGLYENHRTFEYTNKQIAKTNYYYGTDPLLRSEIYNTNADGNIASAQYVQGTSNNTATFTYENKANPLYGIDKNPALAFMPQGLWTNIEIVLFSKNLIKEFAYTGDGTRVYAYTFDSKNRISKITVANKTTNVVNQTYSLSYLD